MYIAEAVFKLHNICVKMMLLAITFPFLYSFDCIFRTCNLVLKQRYTPLVFSHGFYLELVMRTKLIARAKFEPNNNLKGKLKNLFFQRS